MQKWYATMNDLIGGWAVGNRDTPLSAYGHNAGDLVLADFMDEDDAKAVAALLNLHSYVPQRLLPAPPAGQGTTSEQGE